MIRSVQNGSNLIKLKFFTNQYHDTESFSNPDISSHDIKPNFWSGLNRKQCIMWPSIAGHFYNILMRSLRWMITNLRLRGFILEDVHFGPNVDLRCLGQKNKLYSNEKIVSLEFIH